MAVPEAPPSPAPDVSPTPGAGAVPEISPAPARSKATAARVVPASPAETAPVAVPVAAKTKRASSGRRDPYRPIGIALAAVLVALAGIAVLSSSGATPGQIVGPPAASGATPANPGGEQNEDEGKTKGHDNGNGHGNGHGGGRGHD
jgi:hypothetical protein